MRNLGVESRPEVSGATVRRRGDWGRVAIQRGRRRDRQGHVPIQRGQRLDGRGHVPSQRGQRADEEGHVPGPWGQRRVRRGHVPTRWGQRRSEKGQVPRPWGRGVAQRGHVPFSWGRRATEEKSVPIQRGHVPSRCFNLTRRSRSQEWDARGRSEKRCRASSACCRQARRLPPLGSAANVAPHSLRASAAPEPAEGNLEKLEPSWRPIKTLSLKNLRTDLEKSCVGTLTIMAGRDYYRFPHPPPFKNKFPFSQRGKLDVCTV